MIHALTPLIWIVIFCSILIDVNHLVGGPLQNLNIALLEMGSKLQGAIEVIDNTLEPIESIGESLAQVSQIIPTIPETIKIPDIAIPRSNLPIQPSVKISHSAPNHSQPAPPFKTAVWKSGSPSPAILAVASPAAQFNPTANVMQSRFSDELVGFGFPSAPKLPNVIPDVIPDKIPDKIPDSFPGRPSIGNPLPTPQITMENVAVSMPTIPGFEAPVPALSLLKAQLHHTVEIMHSLHRVIGMLPDPNALTFYFQGQYWQTLQTIGGKLQYLSILAGVIALLAIPWLALTYVAWVSSRLALGWKLMIGQRQLH